MVTFGLRGKHRMGDKLIKRIGKLAPTFSIFIILLAFLFIFSTVAGAALVYVDPPSKIVSPGQSFSINIYCSPSQPIKSYEFKISFNPSLLQANSVTEGNIFSGRTTFFNPGTINNVAGNIINIYGLILGKGNVTSPGTFATISFTAKTSVGTSLLHLYDVGVTNETDYTPISIDDGNVTIYISDNPDEGDNPPSDGGFIPPPITGENNPPNQPVKSSGPTSIERGVVYEYSSYTYDVDGDQVKLMFDWGDGVYSNWSEFVSSNTTISMFHSWNSSSSYTIKVIAQDEKGLNSTWSEPLMVTIAETTTEDEPPYMEIKTPDNMISNDTIFFDASGSYDLNGVIVSYQWDFGDGETGTGINTTHTYKTPGNYIVTLVVTDSEGNAYSTSIGVNVASEVAQSNFLQQERGGPFPIFNIIAVCIFILLLSVMVVFRNDITLFLFDMRLYLLRQQVFDERNKLQKPIGTKKRINYYSTVTTPPFSVEKRESSKGTPKKLHDRRLKKEKIHYDPSEIPEEEKRLSKYYKFNIRDKSDKLVKTSVAFKDKIHLFLLDTHLHLLKHQASNQKNKLHKPAEMKRRIDYYSTVTNPPFTIKKKKLFYNPSESFEEEKSFDKYDKFNVGDKISKLIRINLRTASIDKHDVHDILEDIRREIDGFHDARNHTDYPDVEKKVDALIHSKVTHKINGI